MCSFFFLCFLSLKYIIMFSKFLSLTSWPLFFICYLQYFISESFYYAHLISIICFSYSVVSFVLASVFFLTSHVSFAIPLFFVLVSYFFFLIFSFLCIDSYFHHSFFFICSFSFIFSLLSFFAYFDHVETTIVWDISQFKMISLYEYLENIHRYFARVRHYVHKYLNYMFGFRYWPNKNGIIFNMSIHIN